MVTSTNDEAINLIREKRKESGYVFATSQTRGRGTKGRKWISHKGNLFGSIFFPLKNEFPPFNEFAIINPIIISHPIPTISGVFDPMRNAPLENIILLTILVLAVAQGISGCSSPINPSAFEETPEDVILFDMTNTTDDARQEPDRAGSDMGTQDSGSVDLVEGDSSLVDAGSDLGTEDRGIIDVVAPDIAEDRAPDTSVVCDDRTDDQRLLS